MWPISEQFYDDNDEDEGLDSLNSPSEDETREDMLKVSIFPPCILHTRGFMLPQQLQVETTNLKAQIRVMKSATTTSQSHAISSASSATSVITTADQDSTSHLEYRGFSKCFAILSKLWMRRSLLRCPYPIGLWSLGPWHPGWCASDAAWNEGTIGELYHLLPSSCHEFIENSALFLDEVHENHSRYLPN